MGSNRQRWFRKTLEQKSERPHHRGQPMKAMYVRIKHTVFRVEFDRPIDRRMAVGLWDSMTRCGTFDKAAAVARDWECHYRLKITIEMA